MPTVRGRDGGFDLVEVHHVGVVHIHEHRPRPEVDKRFHRREGRVAGHDDFVARADALKLVQQIDNQRPGGAQDALLGAGISRQLGLKGLGFLAEDVLAGAQRAQGGLLDFRVNEAFR